MIPEPSAAAASRSSQQHDDDAANSSGAVNHSEDDSGNENRQKSVRRRKRAHTASENVTNKSAKAVRSSTSRGRGSRQKHVEAVTLFEVITMGRGAMQAVIDDWIEAYVTDRDSSLLDLISFFIQCCGCKGVVTAEMCQSKEDGDVMSKMVEELDEAAGLQYKKFLAFPWILTVTWPMDTDSVEYPLIQSGPYGRWFHSEFCDFVSVLVTQSQHSVIFDSYLMNTIISLLAELSDSYVRAFRHTCTLAAVKLLSSLVGVALSLSVGIENSQKLSEVQKRKTMRQKSSVQLERTQKKITELQEKRTEIENMMDIIFKSVFLKRYRDVLPEIRSICMEELGLWMKLYSSTFLNDSYLKYVGWMMHDKVPDVRLKCVLSLQGLYGDSVLLPKLDLFTNRFKERMISMTLDKDNEVAMQTMKLLVLISKTSDEVLSSEDYDQLLQFVYSSQRPLAAAAGELLYSRLLCTESETQDDLNEEDEQKRETLTRIKALLRFCQQSQLHKHVVYLVDSLWDCGGSVLKDWSTLTSVLLQEPPSLTLTREEEAVLVEILVASVRQASEGPVLAGRSGAKKVMSAREKKVQVDDCSKLTDHLMVVLPLLLSKFSESPDVVSSLMKIPQFFVTENNEAGNSQVVSDLLSGISSVLNLHSSPLVLEAAARSFLSLCSEESTFSAAAQSVRDELLQNWTEKLRKLLQSCLKDDTFTADEAETAEILVTLKKLRAFYNCHDLSRWKLFELLSPVLSAGGAQGGPTPEMLLELLQCLSFSIIWSLNVSADTLTSRDKAVSQRLQLRLFCERAHHSLSHLDLSVRQQAFLGVCDVLTAHSYQLHLWDPSSFGPLLYTPSPKLQRALLTFVCQHVFVGAESDGHSGVSEHSEEERLEDLHRRRNLLAAFCKLIVHGVLEMSVAAEVFMFYMKYYNDFGDIIKETMYRTRQVDKIESARTLVLCLQQLFMRLKREQESGGGGGGRSHPGVQTFTSIKELARRFALTFGDLVKFRECVVLIHRNGIEFVFQEFSQTPETPTPLYLSYLTILSEFSCKLLKPDKKSVFSYLQKHTTEHLIDLRDECWQPLIYYRASLLAAAEGEDAVSYVSSDRRPNRSPLSKQKIEGSKSPCTLANANASAEAKVSKGQRSSFSPSRQDKPADLDPFSVPVDPPARRLTMASSVLSASNEVEEETVEVEL